MRLISETLNVDAGQISCTKQQNKIAVGSLSPNYCVIFLLLILVLINILIVIVILTEKSSPDF